MKRKLMVRVFISSVVLVGIVFGAERGLAVETVSESARKIPLAFDVDVIVVGGSTRAVAAAQAAAEAGASVFLAAPRPYLGEDMCGTSRLWLEPDEIPTTKLGKSIFATVYKPNDKSASTQSKRVAVKPMEVKRALDVALLDAKVDFLYGSYPTDILRDKKGELTGIVMANRSGRQAVRGKVIIDATDRAVIAELAGAEFAPFPSGKQRFSRIVVGGAPKSDAVDTGAVYYGSKNKASYKVYEYSLELPMADGSWASYAKADQEARNRTWQIGQVSSAEMLYHVPPDPLHSLTPQTGSWPGVEKLNLEALRPKNGAPVYVLSARADIPREAAAALLRPLAGIQLGMRVGVAAATDAKARKIADVSSLEVAGARGSATVNAEVGEMLNGLRSTADISEIKRVNSLARSLPVIARYDTVVIGGGTGGASAGIGAARGGAKTLVVEYLYSLGGVGTLGQISKYWCGNKVGFTTEMDKGVVALAEAMPSHTPGKKYFPHEWNIENKMEWLRSEFVKAGGDIWFLSLGAGSVVRDKRFVGVVVVTPQGRGVVLCNTVIDATGNSVIPACAGLETQSITGEHISVQGTGLATFRPGEGYNNSDWTFLDDDDVLDMWGLFVVARSKNAKAYDVGQLIDTRARRRIVGDVTISPMDIINKRSYSDVITVAKSNFDNHGFSSHSLFMVTPPNDRDGLVGNVSYRALLPKGYDGILVTGLGISAHGDAMPVLRMQPDVQNQGYAAGRASAMAAASGGTVRTIDIKELQKHLVDMGIIPVKMLTEKDFSSIGPEKLSTAVQAVGKDYSGIATVLAEPAKALPLLQDAWKKSSDEASKLRYAHVLGMMYDPTGVESLMSAVSAAPWDKGWNFRGMGQFGATTSPLDNLVVALGRTGDKRVLPVIIEKLNLLTTESEFSHCRAVAMALERYKDPKAAAALARLLEEPGVSGHAFEDVQTAITKTPGKSDDTTTRNLSLRELILARALYRCGDKDGLGEKILRDYASDLRGHYATHAKAILREK